MKRILLTAIRAYQTVTRSGIRTPFTFGAYSGCRSWPTCSDYAAQTISRHGVLRGGTDALLRFVRCHPLTAPRI